MNYEDLKREIVEISEISASVPEPFREKCFELLVSHLLGSTASETPGESDPSGEEETKGNGIDSQDGAQPLPIQSQLRVFMNKTGVTKDELEHVVMFEDGEVHFIREPTPKNVAAGQMEWTLLLALKSGIESNKLEADPEGVRSICQDKGVYDKSNFSAIFKRPANVPLFKQPLEPQGDPQPLSSDGQIALGKLVKRLAAESPAG
jgi:hypothetical protein